MQQFDLLDKPKQHKYLLKNGIFLESQEKDESFIVLFKLDHCYAVVHFDVCCTKIIHSKTFENKEKLYSYIAQDKIPVLS
ncbi:hypothetical protein OCK74_15095 [Chitinophagaceae bacterium LB-8]|uniref:Uncharacterized protein n=1 Tax=Paraflavisolibacter caeni TaxID=2982496 RepID=A0A9X3B903_9BACT|nr:hypothetical protein [Paraflavisolibacter caeni]MCU7550446.1 hypothetical protein [Paraflavisolibacter caeni]